MNNLFFTNYEFMFKHNFMKTGDKLVRRKGIFLHYGIYVGIHQGRHLVAENNSPNGVQYVTFDQFLNGEQLLRTERFKGTELQRNKVIPFVNSKIGTAYDLALYNCEHFANEVQTGRSYSAQVMTAGIFGLIAAVFFVDNTR